MARRFAPWGAGRTDAVVKEFLEDKGINSDDVQAYRIARSANDLSVIELVLAFEDTQPEEVKEQGNG